MKMNKKLTFWLVGSIAVIVAAMVGYGYVTSFQDVTVTIKNPQNTLTLELYKGVVDDHDIEQTGPVLRTISATETFSVKKGSYVLLPKGQNIDTSPIAFSVDDKPYSQVIDLPYMDTYLKKLLAEEVDAILRSITNEYPTVNNRYTINAGKLYHRGEWYGTTLTSKENPDEYIYADTVRILLKKQNNTWTVASIPPEIVLSSPTYPNTPPYILKDINQL
jgi:hypothetical protein